MSQYTGNTEPPFPVFAAVLSFLVPGLGQIAQGRVGKGLLFMVCLLGLFHVGQAMGDWKNVYLPPIDQRGDAVMEGFSGRPRMYNPLLSVFYQRWHYAGQVWIGLAAMPALWQYYDMPVPSKELHPLLHDYQRGPRTYSDDADINTLTVESDKSLDLAWIYTVIAGMLNILVIYDALAGPAYGPRMHGKETKAVEEAVLA